MAETKHQRVNLGTEANHNFAPFLSSSGGGASIKLPSAYGPRHSGHAFFSSNAAVTQVRQNTCAHGVTLACAAGSDMSLQQIAQSSMPPCLNT